jgi:hypothetical protein
MKCKICKIKYDIGADHKITGMPYFHFCSDECAQKYMRAKDRQLKRHGERLRKIKVGLKPINQILKNIK